jgi:hypothetical protein
VSPPLPFVDPSAIVIDVEVYVCEMSVWKHNRIGQMAAASSWVITRGGMFKLTWFGWTKRDHRPPGAFPLHKCGDPCLFPCQAKVCLSDCQE